MSDATRAWRSLAACSLYAALSASQASGLSGANAVSAFARAAATVKERGGLSTEGGESMRGATRAIAASTCSWEPAAVIGAPSGSEPRAWNSFTDSLQAELVPSILHTATCVAPTLAANPATPSSGILNRLSFNSILALSAALHVGVFPNSP